MSLLAASFFAQAARPSARTATVTAIFFMIVSPSRARVRALSSARHANRARPARGITDEESVAQLLRASRASCGDRQNARSRTSFDDIKNSLYVLASDGRAP